MRQILLQPRLRRRIRHQLPGLVLTWLVPAVVVVASAYAVAGR